MLSVQVACKVEIKIILIKPGYTYMVLINPLSRDLFGLTKLRFILIFTIVGGHLIRFLDKSRTFGYSR